MVHHFYFGTDRAAVSESGQDDEEFQFTVENGGNVFPLAELRTVGEYFWRVDAQDEWGNIQKGDTWMIKFGRNVQKPS